MGEQEEEEAEEAGHRRVVHCSGVKRAAKGTTGSHEETGRVGLHHKYQKRGGGGVKTQQETNTGDRYSGRYQHVMKAVTQATICT